MGLSPGDLIAGKYRIERLLGEGGMGAVYVSTNERLHKQVALKVLAEQLIKAPGAAERFIREAIAAARVRHPGVVEIYDADIHEGIPWIAMELLEGESLALRLMRGPLPVERTLPIMVQACEAIAAVHDVGIVHRDLKPDNLFIERLAGAQERVKVLDFGVAKVAVEGLDRMTKTGFTMGTPEYLAPEQATGAKEVDARADVYSMGVILYQTLTNRLPYDAETFGGLVAQMMTRGPTSIGLVAPQLPPSVIGIIDRCIAVPAEQRPQTMHDVVRELRAIQAGLGTQQGVPLMRTMPAGSVAAQATPNPAAVSSPVGAAPSVGSMPAAAAVPPPSGAMPAQPGSVPVMHPSGPGGPMYASGASVPGVGGTPPPAGTPYPMTPYPTGTPSPDGTPYPAAPGGYPSGPGSAPGIAPGGSVSYETSGAAFATPPKRSRLGLVLGVLAGLMVIAGLTAGAVVLLTGDKPAEVATTAVDTPPVADTEEAPPEEEPSSDAVPAPEEESPEVIEPEQPADEEPAEEEDRANDRTGDRRATSGRDRHATAPTQVQQPEDEDEGKDPPEPRTQQPAQPPPRQVVTAPPPTPPTPPTPPPTQTAPPQDNRWVPVQPAESGVRLLVRNAAGQCARGAHGLFRVRVTLAPSGRVTFVDASFRSSPVEQCIERRLRATQFQRFSGPPYGASYSFAM